MSILNALKYKLFQDTYRVISTNRVLNGQKKMPVKASSFLACRTDLNLFERYFFLSSETSTFT